MAAPELAPWINSAGEDGDRNSMQQFDGNGTQKSFDFNFAGGYIFATDVKAYLYDLASGLTTAVDPVVLTGPNTIFVDPAPTAVNVGRTVGQVLVVYRDTQKTVPLVDYSTGAVMDEANLDMSNKQAVFVAAEMVDRFDSINASSADAIARSFEALTKAEDALVAADAAQDAAVAAAGSASAAAASAAAASATADNALAVANGIDAKAQLALDNSEDAQADAAAAVATANAAQATADGLAASIATANANASTAVSTANAATSTANAAAAAVATAMQKSANLSDVASAATARSNLDVYSKSEVRALIPAGAIFSFPATTAPAGFLELAGQLVNRADYPDLWAFAQASGNLVADGSWTGSTGAFSSGNGSTTFRLPEYRGEFQRGWDHGRGLDPARNISVVESDTTGPHVHPTYAAASGVTGGAGSLAYIPGDNNGVFLIPGNANHGVQPNTGTTETRPHNVASMFCIKT